METKYLTEDYFNCSNLLEEDKTTLALRGEALFYRTFGHHDNRYSRTNNLDPDNRYSRTNNLNPDNRFFRNRSFLKKICSMSFFNLWLLVNWTRIYTQG